MRRPTEMVDVDISELEKYARAEVDRLAAEYVAAIDGQHTGKACDLYHSLVQIIGRKGAWAAIHEAAIAADKAGAK